MPAFRPSRISATMLAVLALLVLSGCAPDAPTEPTASPPPAATPSPGETTAPAEPTEPAEPPVPEEFIADGTAEDNAPVLQGVLERLVDQTGERPVGRSITSAAAQAGFDLALMELTADVTPLGLATDAITVAVRIQDECVVAELRGTDVTTIVTPVLSTDRCLVGATVSLD